MQLLISNSNSMIKKLNLKEKEIEKLKKKKNNQKILKTEKAKNHKKFKVKKRLFSHKNIKSKSLEEQISNPRKKTKIKIIYLK